MKHLKRPHRYPYSSLSLWSFCLRSVFKEYGTTFLGKVVASHPIKTLKGIHRHSQFCIKNPSSCHVLHSRNSELRWPGGKGSVVGIGFCAKPLEPGCVSGRANHDCYYFEHHPHLRKDTMPNSCQKCLVREIGSLALAVKSDFYIMTSAKDILSDLFLPALNLHTYSTALLGLCQYSFEPFKIAPFISGIDAFLFPFAAGDCEDYRTWRRADKGIKDTQTHLKDHDLETITALLGQSRQKSQTEQRYIKTGNIFQVND